MLKDRIVAAGSDGLFVRKNDLGLHKSPVKSIPKRSEIILNYVVYI